MNHANSLLLGRAFQALHRNTAHHVSDLGLTTLPLHIAVGGDVIALKHESHVVTIAPPNSGKASSIIIPNLLSYSGPVVVIDPTGIYFNASSRIRSQLGPVLRLDPFRVIEAPSDALNPFDLVPLGESEVDSHCQLVAELLFPRVSLNDAWENGALSLLAAIIAYLQVVPEKQKSFSEVVRTLHSDDVIYNLAVVLDTIGKRLSAVAYSELASFLQRSDAERGRILLTLTSRQKSLMSQEVFHCLDSSSLPLTDVIEGKPFTAYLMVPPAKLRSYSGLLRIWLGTLLHCVTSRRVVPANRTLFLLDECAQFDHFSALEVALTLCKGYGFQAWTFWDDLSQLRTLYPVTWPIILKNCGALQVFGDKDYSASAEMAAVLGVKPEEVTSLEVDEQIVRMDGVYHKIKKLDVNASVKV